MLTYSLKAKAGVKDGAVLSYAGTDGRIWRVRIVGVLPVRSGILEGALIVDEKRFADLFPEDGYRLWLCDYAPYLLRAAEETGDRRPESGGRVSGSSAAGLRSPGSGSRLRYPEPGVTVQTVEARLRLLGEVEGAYIDMFLVLGGLGVVLGAAGIALVILRGVAERRGELALLGAVGLPRRTVVTLLASEYGTMTLTGLAVGILSALVSIQPAVRALKGSLPWGAMTGIVAGLFACAAVNVLFAAVAASHRYGPGVLKEEV